MKIIKNLIGNFSLIFVFISVINCSKKLNYSDIGNEIISENRNVIFDSLSIFDIKREYNVELNGNVGKDSSIFYNYDLTMIDSSFIKRLGIRKMNMEDIRSFKLTLPKTFLIDKRECSISNNEPLGKVISVELFNFHIDKKNNEAFLMARKRIKGGIGYKTDIYYFKKIKNKWKYIRKNIVAIG